MKITRESVLKQIEECVKAKEQALANANVAAGAELKLRQILEQLDAPEPEPVAKSE